MTDITPIMGLSNEVEVATINVDIDYAREWNIDHYNDFLVLIKNGQLLRNTLYRKHSIGLVPNEYFLFLKYVEEYYNDSVINDVNNKKQLVGYWCILDKFGNEKYVADNECLEKPRLIRNSRIYALGDRYYNITSGVLIAESSEVIETDETLIMKIIDSENRKNLAYIVDKRLGMKVQILN